MDWANQNKLRNWLIVVLLGLNLLTVSTIWMQSARRNEPPPAEQGARGSESATLMKKVLDLNDTQTTQIQSILTAQREQSKGYNERLTDLKKRLAEELFKANPDTSSADAMAREIGEVQSKVEMIRFHGFSELLAICTPEQREKLKPIVIEVFGRKPPKEEAPERELRRDGREEGSPVNKNPGETTGEKPPVLRDERPAPPSMDEKLARYSERLNLSAEQVKMIRLVLEKSRQEGEELRGREHPAEGEIEAAKERIRKHEDDQIMAILNEDQKKEFAMMISKRRP